jgi:hypothetical protein
MIPSLATPRMRRALNYSETSGDEGDRTLDLRLAKPALYQLSYVPGDLSLQRSLFGLMTSNRACTLAVNS